MADSQVVELPARTDPSVPVTPVNNNPPPVQQTPVIHKSATQEHSMDVPLAKEAYDALAEETRGHYFVGMNPDSFIKEFLPWNADTPINYKKQLPDETRSQSLKSVPPTDRQTESHMYGPFVKALDGWVTGTDTKQKLRFGRFTNPDRYCASMNVDISTYWEEDFPTAQGSIPASCTFSLHQTHEEFKSDISHDAFTHESDEGPKNVIIVEELGSSDDTQEASGQAKNSSEDTANANVQPSAETSAAAEKTAEEAQGSPKVAMATTMQQDVQVKKEEQEGLSSLISQVETDSQSGNHTRGQIAAYAGVAMSMAFRSHLFSVLILGQYARLIRWDRRGAIVTSRFDYTIRPNIIFEFYLRFGQLSPRQRGFDTNVELLRAGLPQHVADAFDKYYLKSWYQGAKYGHRGNPSDRISASQMPFFRIRVEDRTQGRIDTFFIPSPAYKHSYIAPFARASRRCLAFLDDAVEPKMCFLKDSWQEVSERTAPEADIYRLLHSKNVPNIASMRLGDDVAGLETETQRKFYTLSHSGRYKHLGTMVCHRLVMDTVARDLSTFTWCKVLLACLADAVDAAQEAYKAGVLHRDISAGNIMITMDEKTHQLRGILIDWDMCLRLKQRNLGVSRTGRTGTWAFISARLLQRPKASTPVIHSLSDDMESVFWVLVYQILRYTQHDIEGFELYQRLTGLFDDAVKSKNTVVGGNTKLNTLQTCARDQVDQSLAKFTNRSLSEVLHQLAVIFRAPYDASAFLAKEAEKQQGLNPQVEAADDHTEKSNEPESNDDDDDDHDDDSGHESDSSGGEDVATDVLKRAVSDNTAIKKDLNDPDEKWLTKYLRRVAKTMEPLGVTPAGLLSTKKNSRPPKNPSKWKPALPSDYTVDFYHMWWAKDANDSALAQQRRVKAVTTSMVNHMNGLSFSSGGFKRPLEDDDSKDQASSKKRRPVS